MTKEQRKKGTGGTMNQRLYTIKEVALRTGMSTQLIRKWEERYGVVHPSRFPNGYRGYTEVHIETLVWLKKRVDEGVPIGLAVQDFHNGAVAPVPAEADPLETIGVTANTRAEEYQRQFLECFLMLDYTSAQRLFDQLAGLHRMDFILMHVLKPALVELGEMWFRKEASEFQEHFGSGFVRDRLLTLKNGYRTSPERPLLVTACTPGERHEIGLLYFCFFAMQYGFKTAYLGPSPAEKGIIDCLHQYRPFAIAFSVSTAETMEGADPFFRRLDAEITKMKYPTKCILGGRVVQEDTVLPGTRHIYLLSGDAEDAIEKMKSLTELTV